MTLMLRNEKQQLLQLGCGCAVANSMHLGGVGEHELGAERRQQHAALQAHAGGHGQDQVVALGRRDEGQPDARVAAGRLHQSRLACAGCRG